MADRLDGKVAVITGASSGMGLATAELFVAEGARVLIADRDVERGETAARQIGNAAHFIKCDVTMEADIAAAVAMAVDRFGGLDIMFNNAGAQGTMARIEDMNTDDWDFTLSLLTRAPMLGIKHAAPEIRKRGGGTILVTSSSAGVRGGMGVAAYAVAKAAAIQLVRMAAGELGGDRIRVNSICPGYIATPIFGRAMGVSEEVADKMAVELAERFAALQPLPRGGKPRDIAEAALFLASDSGSFITGIDLVVDGGMLIQPSVDINDPTNNAVAALLMNTQRDVTEA
ncbi:3-oxoacyl-(acyl-carrier-protein) reductase [Sphingobium chlorophenolicum L-1]|uniref:3-oxoacyl-(Acyl-carrier-protein) reductase n=1 Tax=Sphingobium chlorophenolicum L-1 TaxID=690566 RepID=F6F371_SPHCR|nr:glucose 1-dehydrogenase [Sphingobium chlorophenolicum]AEG50883.1 3-oxoacyl-(acyl-carrier-protein) reductase [Sphingobium chlorophenolicum L-1]